MVTFLLKKICDHILIDDHSDFSPKYNFVTMIKYPTIGENNVPKSCAKHILLSRKLSQNTTPKICRLKMIEN